MNLLLLRNIAAMHSPNKHHSAVAQGGLWDPSAAKRIIAVWCSSGEGDRAVNMSHAGFPLGHYSVIEISLETQAQLRNSPDTHSHTS